MVQNKQFKNKSKMKIRVLKLKKSGAVNIHIHHPFKLSNAGFIHFPFLALSVGAEGIGVHVLGLSVGIGWKE